MSTSSSSAQPTPEETPASASALPVTAPARRIQMQESQTSLRLTLSPPLEAASLAELSHLLENWNPPPVLQIFRTYAWPGNIRELLNVIERALIVAQERALAALHKFSAPILGVAVGAVPPLGCALLSACDLLLAAEGTVFYANGGAAALALLQR